jgi:alpha-galactosidase
MEFPYRRFALGVVSFIALAAAPIALADTIRLDELNIQNTQQDFGDPHRDKSVDGHPLNIGGQHFEHGLGTHAISVLYIAVNSATKFSASVGVDGEVTSREASVEFSVSGDGKELWHSGVMRAGEAAKSLQVEVAGIKTLVLKVGDAGDGISFDHADWADAQFEYSGVAPTAESAPHEVAVILTPAASAAPRINGPLTVGVRPGHPFFYHFPVTGSRPMEFTVGGLPEGLSFDSERGEISGKVTRLGNNPIWLEAKNAYGKATHLLEIKVGGTIALTPPLGWNSWNCFANQVDDAKIRAAADAMVSSGLIDHGWTYINIDDCWEGKRDASGMIQPNRKFPDMKALAEYVHSRGLKIGLYSSPGPKTCAGFAASWQHESQDAQQYANWGFDYLKYDWCSYSQVQDKSLPEHERLMKPYQIMDAALLKQDRDIVFSLCQYGMGKVWEWGAEVGGNCWRTTGDIRDSWSSMAGIGFSQNGHEKYAGPGHWNDPDMLVVGKVGWGNLHPSHLTANEQYTHVSLWCLLSAPLLIGADMSQLDAFTLNLLANDEVLAVDQDALGKQAARISKNDETEVWAKKMADNSMAVGLFNRGEMPAEVKAQWQDLGLTGKRRVRDLWRQKDAGEFENSFSATVPRHGVVLVRVFSLP